MIGISLLLAAAGVAQTVSAEPVVFSHEPWQGRCFRDGYLAGMDHELCRATMEGPVAITFERTASGIEFAVTTVGCPPLTLAVTPPPATLAPKQRAGSVAGMLQFVIRDMLKTCRSKLKAPKIDAAEFGAVLVETDGLEAMQ